MDITPMIDITFLLLIFFVVASKMDPAANVELPVARFVKAVPTKDSVIVTVAPGRAGGQAAVYKGDRIRPEEAIPYRDFVELDAALEQHVTSSILEDPRKRFVLIKAAGKLKHREFARVSQAVSRVTEVQGLHVAVLEEQ